MFGDEASEVAFRKEWSGLDDLVEVDEMAVLWGHDERPSTDGWSVAKALPYRGRFVKWPEVGVPTTLRTMKEARYE